MKGDQISRTATQVRSGHLGGQNGAVHALKQRDYDPDKGVIYTTECDRTFRGDHGAVLTTADATCHACRYGTPAVYRGEPIGDW